MKFGIVSWNSKRALAEKLGKPEYCLEVVVPSLFGARDWFLEDNFPTDWECGGDDLGMV